VLLDHGVAILFFYFPALLEVDMLLNEHKEFSWANPPDRVTGYAKISVGGESFWVRDCTVENGVVTGIIDNDLLFSEKHGLNLHDKVHFKPA